MRSPTTAKSHMRPKCTGAQGPGFQLGPSALVRIGRAFDEAPLRSPKRAKTSMILHCAPAARPRFQLGPSSLVHMGGEFNKAPVSWCTGPTRAKAPAVQ